jgi:hypothetical protein
VRYLNGLLLAWLQRLAILHRRCERGTEAPAPYTPGCPFLSLGSPLVSPDFQAEARLFCQKPRCNSRLPTIRLTLPCGCGAAGGFGKTGSGIWGRQ